MLYGNSGQPVKVATVASLANKNGIDFKICMIPDGVYYNQKDIIIQESITLPVWFKKGAEPRYICYCNKVTETKHY